MISPTYQPAAIANHSVDIYARPHVERMLMPETDRSWRAESVDGARGRESTVDSESSLKN
jgi:hypothetical protein